MAEGKKDAAAQRCSQLAAIHVAKTQLGLSDDDYRAMVRSIGQVDSAADLDWAGRNALLDALRKLGWKSTRVRPRGPRATPQSDKIKALWLELHRKGKVKDPGEKALSAFCVRMARVSRPEWLTSQQANVVIEALKAWLARAE